MRRGGWEVEGQSLRPESVALYGFTRFRGSGEWVRFPLSARERADWAKWISARESGLCDGLPLRLHHPDGGMERLAVADLSTGRAMAFVLKGLPEGGADWFGRTLPPWEGLQEAFCGLTPIGWADCILERSERLLTLSEGLPVPLENAVADLGSPVMAVVDWSGQRGGEKLPLLAFTESGVRLLAQAQLKEGEAEAPFWADRGLLWAERPVSELGVLATRSGALCLSSRGLFLLCSQSQRRLSSRGLLFPEGSCVGWHPEADLLEVFLQGEGRENGEERRTPVWFYDLEEGREFIFRLGDVSTGVDKENGGGTSSGAAGYGFSTRPFRLGAGHGRLVALELVTALGIGKGAGSRGWLRAEGSDDLVSWSLVGSGTDGCVSHLHPGNWEFLRISGKSTLLPLGLRLRFRS